MANLWCNDCDGNGSRHYVLEGERRCRTCNGTGRWQPADRPRSAAENSVEARPHGANIELHLLHGQGDLVIQRGDVADVISCLLKAYSTDKET